MPSQTTFGVPYPLPTDPVSAGADDIKRVAEALDSKVLAGRLDWGPAAAAADASLYRHAPGVLRTPGQLYVDTDLLVDVVGGGAKIYFGSAIDTNLYRAAAGVLATDGPFRGKGDLMANQGTANQIWIGHDGGAYSPMIRFGSGAGDTNLYRSGASALRTDGSLFVGQGLAGLENVFVDYGGGGYKLYFGSALDTNLYRSAAYTLRTDGVLYVGDSLAGPAGAGAPKLYCRNAANRITFDWQGGVLQFYIDDVPVKSL